jgi:alkylhydroperoxidase family enzyme
MAWIKMIPEENVHDDYLRSLYEKYREPHGGVDHIIKVHSLNPKSMQLHYDYYKHLMKGKSGLSRAQREMIAVVVSTRNECHY